MCHLLEICSEKTITVVVTRKTSQSEIEHQDTYMFTDTQDHERRKICDLFNIAPGVQRTYYILKSFLCERMHNS